jgi:glutamine synthetase
VSAAELVALVCCDLGAIVRGRSVVAQELDQQLQIGVGWVPANHSLTPLVGLAEPNPFGSVGDLRLLPDPDTRIRLEPEHGVSALELVLCDIVQSDGQPWECCPRRFLRDALGELRAELGLRAIASFEHEFQLLLDDPPGPAFSLAAAREVEGFAGEVIEGLRDVGARPERFMAEFAPHQFEIPVHAAEGIGAADRAVIFREVVREVARRRGQRATFVPLLDPAGPGNGVHIHLSLLDQSGRPALYDESRLGSLSELGGRFAAGVLRHAAALSALSAPSPASGARLAPHHWSAGAACLALANREALLRIPTPVSLAGCEAAPQQRLEYRGADATANPYLALAAILKAGLAGVREGLPEPPILDRDPALLDGTEAERFGVGALPPSLPEALQALAADHTVRGWLGETLYDAYTGVKRAELAAVQELDLAEVCQRYAQVY